MIGSVRNLTTFGAFVEIENGIDGLVHVSDMSWTKRVEHPSDFLEKGQEVEVMVLYIDPEAKRISLGMKQTIDDPWPEICDRFEVDLETKGTVVSAGDQGVLVDLGDDIEGFVPTVHSGIPEADGNLLEYFRSGEGLDLRVVESDAAEHRITLESLTLPERMEVPEAEETGEVPEAEETEEVPEAEETGEVPEAEETEEVPEAEETEEVPEAEETEEVPEAEETGEVPEAEETEEVPEAEETEEVPEAEEETGKG
jgi:small subunit ribosomal protein S1